jgi:glycosyltransferase involved in cell wall biosynthesis
MTTPRRKKILVACNHLATVGGSELYTFYLIKALKKLRKYELSYFTHSKGTISDRIEKELGVPFKSGSQFDLIIASHNTTVNFLFGQGRILQVCHGPIPEMEQPSPLADYHIAVSEEVKAHLATLGFPSTVVLNGIDMDTFTQEVPISEKPQRVLSLCQSKEANEWLSEICEEENLRFSAIDKHRNPSFRVNKEINNADLVIGIGRSVYDAMACGRPCILFDKRSYNGNLGDGYLKPDTFAAFVRYNCSGRYSKRKFSKSEMKREIGKYRKQDGLEPRKIAQERLNLKANTDALLQIGFGIQQIAHLRHRLGVFFRWVQYRKLFAFQKRQVRAQMQAKFTEGRSLFEIQEMIAKERFVLPLRVSLYAYWLKLWLKGS